MKEKLLLHLDNCTFEGNLNIKCFLSFQEIQELNYYNTLKIK